MIQGCEPGQVQEAAALPAALTGLRSGCCPSWNAREQSCGQHSWSGCSSPPLMPEADNAQSLQRWEVQCCQDVIHHPGAIKMTVTVRAVQPALRKPSALPCRRLFDISRLCSRVATGCSAGRWKETLSRDSLRRFDSRLRQHIATLTPVPTLCVVRGTGTARACTCKTQHHAGKPAQCAHT